MLKILELESLHRKKQRAMGDPVFEHIFESPLKASEEIRDSILNNGGRNASSWSGQYLD